MAINWFYAPQGGYIPGRDTQLENLTVTQNGTYNPDPGKGFAQVNVNVEGGGGSSDFSTAEVTIVGETQSVSDWQLRNSYFPYVDNDELLITSNVEMGTYSAVLYKDSLTLIPYFPPTVEGDASVVKEGKDVYVVITGNCTITVPEIA